MYPEPLDDRIRKIEKVNGKPVEDAISYMLFTINIFVDAAIEFTPSESYELDKDDYKLLERILFSADHAYGALENDNVERALSDLKPLKSDMTLFYAMLSEKAQMQSSLIDAVKNVFLYYVDFDKLNNGYDLNKVSSLAVNAFQNAKTKFDRHFGKFLYYNDIQEDLDQASIFPGGMGAYFDLLED